MRKSGNMKRKAGYRDRDKKIRSVGGHKI